MDTSRFIKLTEGVISRTLSDPNYKPPEEPNHPVVLRPDAQPRELEDNGALAVRAELKRMISQRQKNR